MFLRMEDFVHVSTCSISLRRIKMHQIISYYYISLSTNAITPTGKLCHDKWEGSIPHNLHIRTSTVPLLHFLSYHRGTAPLAIQLLFHVPSLYGSRHMSLP